MHGRRVACLFQAAIDHFTSSIPENTLRGMPWHRLLTLRGMKQSSPTCPCHQCPQGWHTSREGEAPTHDSRQGEARHKASVHLRLIIRLPSNPSSLPHKALKGPTPEHPQAIKVPPAFGTKPTKGSPVSLKPFAGGTGIHAFGHRHCAAISSSTTSGYTPIKHPGYSTRGWEAMVPRPVPSILDRPSPESPITPAAPRNGQRLLWRMTSRAPTVVQTDTNSTSKRCGLVDETAGRKLDS